MCYDGKVKPVALSLVDDNKSDHFTFEQLCRGARNPPLEVVAMYSSGEECLEKLDDYEVDVLLVDLGLPKLNGPELVAALRSKWPRLPIVIWTGSDRRQDLYQCLQQKINGFLEKEHSSRKHSAEFAAQMQRVINGKVVISQKLLRVLFDPAGLAGHSFPRLTRREGQVLECISQGTPAKGIADHLHISEETVKQHSKAARRKCGADSSAEAIRRYKI